MFDLRLLILKKENLRFRKSHSTSTINHQTSNIKSGFTLVELLVVLAILGVLVGFLLPAIQAAREASRRTQCQNNLRQLGVGMLHHTDSHGALPVGCIGCQLVLPADGEPFRPQRFISWNVHLLPFLEQTAIWKQFDQTLTSYSHQNRSVGSTVINLFLCPSTPREDLTNASGLWRGFAFTDYAGIYGVEGEGHDIEQERQGETAQTLRDESLGVLLYEQAVAPHSITDGLAYTASVAETILRRQIESEWVSGQNLFAQEFSTPINVSSKLGNDIGSPHPGGAYLAFCDGHVEFVIESLQQTALNAMLTKSGGELP
ncbi:MAG: DUF1559 domain-containing protein [Pirellulales bacterium]